MVEYVFDPHEMADYLYNSYGGDFIRAIRSARESSEDARIDGDRAQQIAYDKTESILLDAQRRT